VPAKQTTAGAAGLNRDWVLGVLCGGLGFVVVLVRGE
jgi:hypothetical protein